MDARLALFVLLLSSVSYAQEKCVDHSIQPKEGDPKYDVGGKYNIVSMTLKEEVDGNCKLGKTFGFEGTEVWVKGCKGVFTICTEEQMICPEEFELHGGVCYKVNTKTTNEKTWITFNQAADTCKQMGAKLPEPRTKEDVEQLQALIPLYNVWIGASDVATEGNFTWNSNNKPIALDYDAWAKTEPSGKPGEDCISLEKDGFYDKQCTSRFRYVCAIEQEKCTEQSIHSWKFRYFITSTGMDTGIESLTLKKQVSNSVCKRGFSYGIKGNKVWVDDGCRGVFTICRKEGGPVPPTITTTTTTTAKPTTSGPEWIYEPSLGVSYKYFPDKQLSFDDANALCKSEGGQLPEPRRKEHNYYISKLVNKPFWLGITDKAKEGKWTYLNGKSLKYSNFHKNKKSGGGDFAYGTSKSGVWKIGNKDDKVTSVLCQRWWIPHPTIQGVSFRYFPTWKLSFWKANEECEKAGGHLPTPRNKAENDFIAKMISKRVWLGFTDRENEGYWKDIVGGKPITWANWKGSPRLYRRAGGDYAYATAGIALWRTTGPGNRKVKAFMCQRIDDPEAYDSTTIAPTTVATTTVAAPVDDIPDVDTPVILPVDDPCYGVTCEVKGAVCENGTCHCPQGYLVDCGICKDIDECHTDQHDCDFLQGFECVNTEGSYECKCREGLEANGTMCSDIDECYFGLLDCGQHSECNNVFASANCECCAGYMMDDQGACIRDPSVSVPATDKCCSCQGSRCTREGQVCGSDGKTYSSYRQLKTQTCLEGKEEVEISYPGKCQATCDTIVCNKKFSTCELDKDGIPQCGCPTCKNVTTMYKEDVVCGTNHITYISLCHLNKDSCEANIETDIQVETVGKPCPPPSGKGGIPAPVPGEWTEWGPCSEKCKQGVQERTRDTNGLPTYSSQTKSCYKSCPEGPCRPDSCPTPGSVCTVNGTGVQCSCPPCEEPKVPICGRIGNVIETFDSECLMFKEACEQGEPDFEMLEKHRCEAKPKGCARIRNFKVYEDANGCKADREIDMGYCYGGCVEGSQDNHGLCCYATKVELKFAILECPDGKRKNKWVKQIKECTCMNNEDVPTPTLL